MEESALEREAEMELRLQDYLFCEEDAILCQGMLAQINGLGYRFRFMAQIVGTSIPKSSNIVLAYIEKYLSAVTQSYLLASLPQEKENQATLREVLLRLFWKFQEQLKEDETTQVHAKSVYRRYDAAFASLNDKDALHPLLPVLQYGEAALHMPRMFRYFSGFKKDPSLSLLQQHLLANARWSNREELIPDPADKTDLRCALLTLAAEIPTDAAKDIVKTCLSDSDKQVRTLAELLYPQVELRSKWRSQKKK
jgi:hypothetical protein